MGEAPELRGFFLGCGFNSAGEATYPGAQGTPHGTEIGGWVVVQSAALLEGM